MSSVYALAMLLAAAADRVAGAWSTADAALLAHTYIVVGYVLIAVRLPTAIFAVRRSYTAMIFVASLWLILASAVQTNIKRWDSPLIVTDAARVVAVTLFLIYLLLHRREAR